MTTGEHLKTIRYRDNHVSDEKLAKVRLKYDNTNDSSKYYKFKEWLHYANLHSRQRESWHSNYSSLDERGKTYLMCSCGLQVLENKLERVALLSASLPEALAHISALSRVPHHVDFNDASKRVAALIAEYQWDSDQGCYLWDAYCQGCLDYVVQATHSAAILFVETHNFLHAPSE